MPDPLNPDADEIRSMGRDALERIAAYYDSLASRPVLQSTGSEALRATLGEPLPLEGTRFSALLETLDRVIIPYSRHNGSPNFFGYISSPGNAISALGALFEAALNINLTSWRSSPAAAELEHITIGWLKELLGYPAEALGLLTSGGSMANLAALAAARSSSSAKCIYVSEEGHFSIHKAARLLGLEQDIRAVRTNERFEMDVDHLERLLAADRASGLKPLAIVASAGTTASGAIDPIGPLVDLARRENLWLHVDAAYGGFAVLAPSVRDRFSRIGDADSVILDPHKWLFHSVGCGCVLYRDPEAARRAFSQDAGYTRPLGFQHDEAFAFWDYGPELSRPFRALSLWMLIKSAGAARLAEAIEQNIACAKYLGTLVQASPDFEMLAPVTLSVFCFRYRPPGFTGDLDTLNQRILMALQRGGGTYLSNAFLRGRFALRGCVVNYRTTRRHMEQVLEDVRAAAGSLL